MIHRTGCGDRKTESSFTKTPPFQDVWSKDELISDSFDLKEVHGGVAYEADASMITIDAVSVGKSQPRLVIAMPRHPFTD